MSEIGVAHHICLLLTPERPLLLKRLVIKVFAPLSSLLCRVLGLRPSAEYAAADQAPLEAASTAQPAPELLLPAAAS